jgi:uncharacterized protein YrrD
MQRARDVIGLPVIEAKRGKEVGYVHDLLFNEQTHLAGILLTEKAFLQQGKYVPAKAICAIGTDCVMITDQRAIVSFSFPPDWITVQTGTARFQGKAFVTTEGEHLGFVEDVYFRVETGNIVGYELSNGFLSDIVDGRKIIRSMHRMKLGEDVVIISGRER